MHSELLARFHVVVTPTVTCRARKQFYPFNRKSISSTTRRRNQTCDNTSSEQMQQRPNAGLHLTSPEEAYILE